MSSTGGTSSNAAGAKPPSPPSGPGISSHTSLNHCWRISTCGRPILKAGPIEALSSDLGIPVPEMIFGENYVRLTHLSSGWELCFNARDALDRVSKTDEGMLQVAVAEDWKKDRKHQNEVRHVVKPFDWSYSTDYRGTVTPQSLANQWQKSDQARDPVRTDLLSRPDPILFFSAIDLYEDELADNGIALLNVKVRMMPERLLILARFFLRLDGVLIRIRDTRVYVEHGGKRVIRQYTAREDKYEEIVQKIKAGGKVEGITEVLRDANSLAPLMTVVEDQTETFDLK